MFFLHVASQVEPVDLTSIGNTLGLSKAATTRNFYRLSVGIRGGTEGLDLVQYQNDPKDIRRKLLTITPKGVEVIKRFN
jgi:DNA-binding MarR family transcriptional regulator